MRVPLVLNRTGATFTISLLDVTSEALVIVLTGAKYVPSLASFTIRVNVKYVLFTVISQYIFQNCSFMLLMSVINHHMI